MARGKLTVKVKSVSDEFVLKSPDKLRIKVTNLVSVSPLEAVLTRKGAHNDQLFV